MAYADTNYDPQKAHEYYEKHKKLKGKRSTKGFSDTQKEQWAYAKDQLKNEHKSNNAAIAESKKAALAQVSENVKAIKEELSEKASAQIDSLRKKLKNMSPEEKKRKKAEIQAVISQIRESVKGQKALAGEKGAEIKDTVKANATIAKETEKADYEKRLDTAYGKIKGNG